MEFFFLYVCGGMSDSAPLTGWFFRTKLLLVLGSGMISVPYSFGIEIMFAYQKALETSRRTFNELVLNNLCMCRHYLIEITLHFPYAV
jgi:hypothetical protein